MTAEFLRSSSSGSFLALRRAFRSLDVIETSNENASPTATRFRSAPLSDVARTVDRAQYDGGGALPMFGPGKEGGAQRDGDAEHYSVAQGYQLQLWW